MKILLLGNYNVDFKERLSKFHEIINVQEKSEAEVLKYIRQIDCIVVRSPHKITSEIIAEAKQLRLIVRAGSGTDNICPSYKEKGVELKVVPQNARSVAEHILALILNLYRKVSVANHSMKEGKWLKSQLEGNEINGKSVGIVGFGNIGREFSKIAFSLGMSINVYDRSLEKKEKREVLMDLNAQSFDLKSLLNVSDIIVVSLPLLDDTYHLFNKDLLNNCKEGSLFINVGRGAIVNTNDLYSAVMNNTIAGIGLDVYENEPPEDHPIFHLDNVVCTPHIGAQTVESKKRIGETVLKIIEEYNSSKVLS